MSKLVLIVGGSTLVYACLAWTMGVWPGIELSRTPAGPGVLPLTTLQSEGREVYVASGCSYCHTQQVRPLDQDKAFGRPSAEGDFAYQTPELLGSERTGPDLTNIGVRQPSSVWQYIHLYDPRAVAPDSIMPSFNWLFEVTDRVPTGASSVPVPKAYAPVHGVVIPSHQAQALVAYLAALKQPPLAVGASANAQSSDAPVDRATPAVASSTIGSLHATVVADSAKGARLFTSNCAACHQANGEGVPGAFPSLKGDAAVNDSNGARQIQVVLHGLHDADVGGVVYASVMPPFSGTLSDAEIADIIDYERSSWGNHGKPVDTAQVAMERAKGN